MSFHPKRGAVAAGHGDTAQAACDILQAGGNAFDAVVAAHFAACVAEPVLASPGGGGFLMAHPADKEASIYDFFVQTPRRKVPETQQDFYPILADFGTATQEFHIGLGAAATPGSVRGLLQVHRELGSLPLREVMAPAVALATRGVTVNAFQAYIFRIVQAIYSATPETTCLYSNSDGTLLGEGDRFRNVHLAELLEELAREGDRFFYEGEIAGRMVEQCRSRGGHLRADDLAQYTVVKRKPLQIRYRDSRLHFNPPPSSGGLLIALALCLLAKAEGGHSLRTLVAAMKQVNEARNAPEFEQRLHSESPPDTQLQELLKLQRELRGHGAYFSRGTTHITVMDELGNQASMTVSNGEGCGHLVPGTGFMLNNMLGEEDLNPGGFHRWREDVRISSMMCPTLLDLTDGTRIAMGSGGSNRIRSAILQVALNLVDHELPVEAAVQAPRLHLESGTLHIESGFADEALRELTGDGHKHHHWPELNLFFGGVHAVQWHPRTGFSGAGDPRRGGIFTLTR